MVEQSSDGDQTIVTGGMGAPLETEQLDPREVTLAEMQESALEIVALIQKARAGDPELSQMSESQLGNIARSLRIIERNFSLEKPQFRKFIAEKADKPMTPQEAVEALALYHDTTPEKVLAAFKNLQGFNDGEVIFKLSRAYGLGKTADDARAVNITMEGYDVNKKLVWFNRINGAGNQQQHSG